MSCLHLLPDCRRILSPDLCDPAGFHRLIPDTGATEVGGCERTSLSRLYTWMSDVVMSAPQATFRLLKGARAALGDTPHVDMLLRRLMLVVLHCADTALFHKLVGGAQPGCPFELCVDLGPTNRA